MEMVDITAEDLGLAFVSILKQELDPDQLQEVRRLNAEEAYQEGDICASHEYLDANEIMLDAWQHLVDEDLDLQNEAHIELCNDAWRWAKANHLTES